MARRATAPGRHRKEESVYINGGAKRTLVFSLSLAGISAAANKLFAERALAPVYAATGGAEERRWLAASRKLIRPARRRRRRRRPHKICIISINRVAFSGPCATRNLSPPRIRRARIYELARTFADANAQNQFPPQSAIYIYIYAEDEWANAQADARK